MRADDADPRRAGAVVHRFDQQGQFVHFADMMQGVVRNIEEPRPDRFPAEEIGQAARTVGGLR